MIDPISVGIVKEYVLKDDKKNPTTWSIGPLDSIMKSKIISTFGKIEVKDNKPVYVHGEVDYSQNNFTIVKYGLKGFKNFLIEGKPLEFKTKKEKVFNIEMDVVSMETLKSIPLFAINELASEIWGENQVDEDLEKN